MSVVIVDDESDLAAIVSEIVSAWGFDPKAFHDKESAIIQIQKERPDFIITDMKMCGGSGLDLIREVRQRKMNIPIMLMSGMDSSEIDEDVLRDSEVQFVKKPFDMDILRSFLKISWKTRRES